MKSKKNKKNYVDYELAQERQRICISCGFYDSCDDRTKDAPGCKKIFKLYNQKKWIKRALKMEAEK